MNYFKRLPTLNKKPCSLVRFQGYLFIFQCCINLLDTYEPTSKIQAFTINILCKKLEF